MNSVFNPLSFLFMRSDKNPLLGSPNYWEEINTRLWGPSYIRRTEKVSSDKLTVGP